MVKNGPRMYLSRIYTSTLHIFGLVTIGVSEYRNTWRRVVQARLVYTTCLYYPRLRSIRDRVSPVGGRAVAIWTGRHHGA